MTHTASAQPADTKAPTNPWSAYGWIMGVIWLGFLAFPVTALLAIAGPAKYIGLSLVVAFATVYSTGFIYLPRRGDPSHRHGTIHLLILVAIAVSLYPLLGPEIASFSPFIVSFTMYNQPFQRAVVLTGAHLVLVLMLLVTSEAISYLWPVAAIALLVAILTGFSSWADSRHAIFADVEQQLGIIAERERVARDVHDVLGHSLTVITVKTELARRLIRADPDRAEAELLEIESLSRESLAEIRATVSGLRIARLGDELDRAEDALAAAGIVVELPADPAVLDPRYRLAAAWVLREAVTNVIRHSDATTCLITLTEASLTVVDNGRGPGSGADYSTSGGEGIRGARERAIGSGGSLNIDPAAAGGTTLVVAW